MAILLTCASPTRDVKKTIATIAADVGILPQWRLKEAQAKGNFFDYEPKFEIHPEEGKSGESFAAFQEAQNHGFLPRKVV
jgi:hypothetical protein